MINAQVLPENIFLFIAEICLCILGLWAALLMNKNFSILPRPAKNSSLIKSGPFKYIRHPIYTAVILLSLIWIAGKFSFINLSVWIFLLVILLIKINYEEKLLSVKFEGYTDYITETKKLIPFIY